MPAPQPPSPADALAACCPDLEKWPAIWRYDERDVAPGQGMVECFKPFLRHLMSLDLSRTTLRTHRDNLWLLGGELIRDLHETPRLRKRPIAELVLAAVDDEGGPLIGHGASEDQQRAFDATCRKLYRFLKGSNSYTVDDTHRQAVDMSTTLKKRCPHAHSPNRNQPASIHEIGNDTAPTFQAAVP